MQHYKCIYFKGLNGPRNLISLLNTSYQFTYLMKCFQQEIKEFKKMRKEKTIDEKYIDFKSHFFTK